MAKLGNRYSYDTMPDITKISNMLRKYRERVIYVVTSLDIVENLEVGGKERVVRDFME